MRARAEASAENGDELSDTISLVRELDYYGLLNYVLPRKVEDELEPWSHDFADIFSVERYHRKVARAWTDYWAKEADMAGISLRCAVTAVFLETPAHGMSEQNTTIGRQSILTWECQIR